MISYQKFLKSRATARRYVIPTLKNAGLEKEAGKIECCGNMVKSMTCTGCGQKYFKSFSRCKSKFCPTCMKLKAYIWCAKLYPKIKDWIASGKLIFFATFTVKNQESLKQALDIVYGAWRAMTHDIAREEFEARFSGGVKSVEVKIGKFSGLWHVHIHTLLFREKEGKDFHFLKNAWNKAAQSVMGTDQKVGSIDVRSISKDTGKDNVLKSIMETVKYMTKLQPFIAPDKMNELFKLLKGRRQISCWGILYGTSEKVDKEMDEKSENEIESFTCSVCGCTEAKMEEIYQESEDYIESLDMKNYKDVCTFVSKPELSKEENATIDKIENEMEDE